MNVRYPVLWSILWSIAVVALPAIAEAQVNKCVDPRTKVTTYSDKACPVGADYKQLSITDNAIMDGAAAQREIVRQNEGQNAASRYRKEQSATGSTPQQVAAASDSPARAKLAGECSRGFEDSCRALRAMNSQSPQAAPSGAAASSEQKDKLAGQCARGIQDSCKALRLLNGENKKTTVCVTSGSAQAYARGGGGTYNDTTVCR